MALTPNRPVGEVTRGVLDAVKRLGGDVAIDPTPQEVSWSVPLDEDDQHSEYDPAHVAAYFAAATQAALALAEFRAPYRGRSTPVNAWWGSFDLAVGLFSGLPAAPPSADFIARNAMDAQEVEIGWWPGDARYPGAAFYAYAHPAPDGFEPPASLPTLLAGRPHWASTCWTGTMSARAPTRTRPPSSSPARLSATPVLCANGIRRSPPPPRERHRPSYDTGGGPSGDRRHLNAERSLRTGAVALLGAAHAPDGMRSRSGKWLAGEHQVGVGLPEPIPLHQRVSHGRVALNLPCRMPGLDEVSE